MRGSLIDIATAERIPIIDDYDAIGLVPETYDDDKIFGLVEYFAATYGGELVLYGGQTATERIYGFKRIRDITTDLDFVCTDAGLERVVSTERLFYHRRYDIFFSVKDNVPLSFTSGHIHDWQVDEGFFSAAQLAHGFHCAPRCCSREYSIMLKMRRMNERIGRGEHPFGKDALDIINMVTAPYIRADLPPVDFPALASLLAANIGSGSDRAAELLSFIAAYKDHLTDWEFSYFTDALDLFSRALVSNGSVAEPRASSHRDAEPRADRGGEPWKR